MWLSTAPTEPLTHWYQVRCLLQSPLFTKAGDTLSGTALLVANKRYVPPGGAEPPPDAAVFLLIAVRLLTTSA